MDTGTKAIRLEGNDFIIYVKEDNPIFKHLSAVVGETVVVYKATTKSNDIELPKKEPSSEIPKLKEKIDRSGVWEKFLKAFPEEDDRETVTVKLIKNHVSNILGGNLPDFENPESVKNLGHTTLTKMGDGLYKEGNSYLKYRE